MLQESYMIICDSKARLHAALEDLEASGEEGREGGREGGMSQPPSHKVDIMPRHSCSVITFSLTFSLHSKLQAESQEVKEVQESEYFTEATALVSHATAAAATTSS